LIAWIIAVIYLPPLTLPPLHFLAPPVFLLVDLFLVAAFFMGATVDMVTIEMRDDNALNTKYL